MASSSNSRKRKYDVFLSFRGEDTRDNFTSHLYDALCRKKIKTFIDNDLERGEEITPALLRTIEDSAVSVIIFSKNYASSPWCLDEMVKILECKDTYEQLVLPVFYHVDPSDVEEQKGSFADAIIELEKKFKEKMEMIPRWRADLMKAASISGWDSRAIRPEAKLVNEIAKHILKKLNHSSFRDSRGLVGIESRIEQIKKLLCIGTPDVRFIGIWGAGGMGKTTIAETICNSLSSQYEGFRFVKNIEEESKKCVGSIANEDWARRTKILLVVDDVNDIDHFNSLIRKYDFELGSRVIVTSRDRQVLKNIVDCVYEVEGLDEEEALQLFNLNAFKKNNPTQDRMELSYRVVKYAEGNPLALKVLGSLLFDRTKQYWESAINKLEKMPPPEIFKVLRLSFDALDDEEQHIFLDIACFFKGNQIDLVERILDSCGFSAHAGITNLVDKCLVTLIGNRLGMHELLQQMAHEIVRKESDKPGKRSRLWNPTDVFQVLTKNQGGKKVQGIFLDTSKIEEVELSSKAFANMVNLRLLKLYYSGVGNCCKVHFPHGLEFLSNELRYLHWDGYPLRSMPPNFQAENLVELNMAFSNVKQLWRGVQNLVNLKEINLRNSEHLITFPDLSRAKNLERMNFEHCTSLVEVPSCVRFLDKLVDWNMKCCQSLTILPPGIKLKALRIFNLSGCPNLREVPEIPENVSYLNLNETAIEELPKSFENLSGLIALNLKNCKQLRSLPESMHLLKSLAIIDLSGCSNITRLSDIPTNIRYLYLRETSIEELPSSTGSLSKLSCLDLTNCKSLKNLPCTISKLASLESFIISRCSSITNFPKVPRQIKKLSLDGTGIEEIPSSIMFCSELVELNLQNCKRFHILPSGICKLQSLQKLNLSGCSIFDCFPEISDVMPSLRYLYLDRTAIRGLPSPIENMKNLNILELRNCKNLLGKYSTEFSLPKRQIDIKNLRKLSLNNCGLFHVPDSIGCLTSLEVLDLSDNPFEVVPEGINKLIELQYLGLRSCQQLRSLPDLPPHLTKLDAHNCFSLRSTSFYSTTAKGNIFEFFFTNCYTLDWSAKRNIVEYALRKILLYSKKLHNQMPSILAGESSFCFPARTIPKFFGHQKEGFSTTIRLPSQWANSEFLGFILCARIAFNNERVEDSGFQVKCRYHFKNDYGECNDLQCYFGGWYGSRNLWKTISYPLFSGYDPCVDVRKGDQFSKHTEVAIEFYPEDMDGQPLCCCKVIDCGVRILYAHPEKTDCQCQPIYSFIKKQGMTLVSHRVIDLVKQKEMLESINFEKDAYVPLQCRECFGIDKWKIWCKLNVSKNKRN